MEKDFVWGVATAAIQIEGGLYEGGKGESIWDVLAHTPGRIRYNENADVSCDHYHHYKEDVKLMGELGVDAYRFSIAWPRIFTNGFGEPNEEGLQFYSDLVDELLKYNITPYVTLFHWDLPLEVFRKGGWLNDEIVEWFANYTRVVAERLGDRVKNFITFNEPQCIIGGMDGWGHAPAVRYSTKDKLLAVHNILKSHGRAVQVLRETVKDVKVGYAPCANPFFPKDDSPEQLELARKAYFSLHLMSNFYNVILYSDPIFFGDYPKEYYEMFKGDIPNITKEDLELISQPLDFYGQNIYWGGSVSPCDNEAGFKEDPLYQGYPRTTMGQPVMPQVIYWGARFLYERYKTPIIITENGAACMDWVHLDGKVHDPQRIDYIKRYTNELLRAKDEGIDVRGYFNWSFIDNFEWDNGYDPRLGLVYVDYRTQERIPKDSFYFYRDLIKDYKEKNK